MRQHGCKERVRIRGVTREVDIEDRKRIAVRSGHQIGDRQALAKIIVGGALCVRGLQDGDDGCRLPLAHPGVRQ